MIKFRCHGCGKWYEADAGWLIGGLCHRCTASKHEYRMRKRFPFKSLPNFK